MLDDTPAGTLHPQMIETLAVGIVVMGFLLFCVGYMVVDVLREHKAQRRM